LTVQRRRFLQLDAILDAVARGERDLCESSASGIILENLAWLRTHGWRIWAATLMPSHLHVVMSSLAGCSNALRKDLAGFMAYTARRINATRGVSGSLWQREPFDHWCREGDAWFRSVSYTVNNPVKAGLCGSWREWPHTVVDEEVKALLS